MSRKLITFTIIFFIAFSLVPITSQAALPRTYKINFTIRGKGHGVGMSMAGVYGMATHSKSYRTIIDHYYPNTSWGKINDNTKISVVCEDGKRRTYTVKGYLYRLAEEPNSWPKEGLRSLMVAARTYLWYKVKKYGYMPGGQYFVHTINPSTRPRIVDAVNDTRGKIKTYGGSPIIAAYSSSAGGYTAAFEDTWPGGSTYPYLVRRSSPYDKYVSNTWHITKTKTVSQIENAYPSIGRLTNMKVIQRNSRGSWGGRVLKIRLYGTSATKTVNGWAFASTLGLDSTIFTFSLRPLITINASRYRIKKGRALRVFGYLRPEHDGQQITIYIYKGKKRYSRNINLDENSRYEWVLRPGHRGIYKLKSRFHGDNDHLSSNSRVIQITVL